MKPPVVLVVGRPNVGKSTLFNRLAGRAAAVVFDRPGVTRDLLEADLTIGGGAIRIMDSAGWPYPGEDRDLTEKINATVERAIKYCELILWVVDGQAGRTGGEDAFAERLMPHRNKTILIVNKLDELQKPSARWADAEFAGLPWTEAFPISAKHGRGISDILTCLESRLKPVPIADDIPDVRDNLPEDESDAGLGGPGAPRDDAVESEPLKISILGRPNVGKSTLVNRLLNRDRMVVSDRPGTTRDAVESMFRYHGRPFSIVDTAGVRRIDRITDGLERTMSKIALHSGETADVTVALMDISQGLAEQDLRLLSFLWRRGVTAVAAANKWDLVPDRSAEDARDLEDEFRKRAHESHEVPFVLVSARTGHGLTTLLNTALAVRTAARQKIRTPGLNRRLQEWNAEFPTGLFRGKPGKLKYGVQTGTEPISFKIFVNDPKTFRGEAIRYLEKRLRSAFGIVGVPIQIGLAENK